MSGPRRFPRIAFGKCPVCGGGGGDDPNPSSADAEARDLVGNGYQLEWFEGELMCELCKKEKLARRESMVDSEKQAEAEEFRAGAGFTRSVT